jgi:hypothetical protein
MAAKSLDEKVTENQIISLVLEKLGSCNSVIPMKCIQATGKKELKQKNFLQKTKNMTFSILKTFPCCGISCVVCWVRGRVFGNSKRI